MPRFGTYCLPLSSAYVFVHCYVLYMTGCHVLKSAAFRLGESACVVWLRQLAARYLTGFLSPRRGGGQIVVGMQQPIPSLTATGSRARIALLASLLAFAFLGA